MSLSYETPSKNRGFAASGSAGPVSGAVSVSRAGDAHAADGTRITGYGINPAGDTEAFYATIPEPGTAVLVGIGLVGMAGWRRGRRDRR